LPFSQGRSYPEGEINIFVGASFGAAISLSPGLNDGQVFLFVPTFVMVNQRLLPSIVLTILALFSIRQ
jgi:hypothetical protein